MTEASAYLVDRPSGLADLFQRDAGNHLYALGDLDEPCWSASTWWRRGDAAVGLVAIDPSVPLYTVYAVSSADPAGSLALLAGVAAGLPPCWVTGPVGCSAALASAGRDVGPALPHQRFQFEGAVPAELPNGVEPLGPASLDEVAALYEAHRGQAFFVPSMLHQDSFVGVRDRGSLVAVAGTHVRSRWGAAIGGVLVAERHRGRGLGRLVTEGVMARLGPSTIGLNCADDNVVAASIYAELGFRPTLSYEECELR